jgi:hypothetical protein
MSQNGQPARVSQGARVRRRGQETIVEWSGVGELVHVPGSEPQFFPHPDVEPSFLEKFTATNLLACRRYLAGGTSLHGSAVAFPVGAIAFVGDSGAGKSTTAMALVEQCGARFCADGVVPIDWVGSDPVVAPVNDSFWLRQDASEWFGLGTSTAWKDAQAPRARSQHPERLIGIVLLEFDETAEFPVVDSLTGRETFTVLSDAHLCYCAEPEEDALRNFTAREQLACSVKVLRLRRRRSLNVVPVVAQVLLSRWRA